MWFMGVWDTVLGDHLATHGTVVRSAGLELLRPCPDPLPSPLPALQSLDRPPHPHFLPLASTCHLPLIAAWPGFLAHTGEFTPRCRPQPVPTSWTPLVQKPWWSVHLLPWTSPIPTLCPAWGLLFLHIVRCPLALFLWQPCTHLSKHTVYTCVFLTKLPPELDTWGHFILSSESEGSVQDSSWRSH